MELPSLMSVLGLEILRGFVWEKVAGVQGLLFSNIFPYKILLTFPTFKLPAILCCRPQTWQFYIFFLFFLFLVLTKAQLLLYISGWVGHVTLSCKGPISQT